MQQLIVLASPDGVVDMTPQAICARTSIPIDIINKGLEVLSKPDPYTRTPGEDGKRIVLMDDHRPWGWRLVNHGKYMRLRNAEQKRAADRERIAEKRSQISDVAIESQMSPTKTQTQTKTQEENQGRADALPDWLPKEAWSAWLEVRRKNRAPNTPRALKLAIAELERLKSLGNDPQAVLERSTMRGWRGVFPLHTDGDKVERPTAITPSLCEYCLRQSVGAVNGIRHCREHAHAAMDLEPRTRMPGVVAKPVAP